MAKMAGWQAIEAIVSVGSIQHVDEFGLMFD
jgi:hypothetical protein